MPLRFSQFSLSLPAAPLLRHFAFAYLKHHSSAPGDLVWGISGREDYSVVTPGATRLLGAGHHTAKQLVPNPAFFHEPVTALTSTRLRGACSSAYSVAFARDFSAHGDPAACSSTPAVLWMKRVVTTMVATPLEANHLANCTMGFVSHSLASIARRAGRLLHAAL